MRREQGHGEVKIGKGGEEHGRRLNEQGKGSGMLGSCDGKGRGVQRRGKEKIKAAGPGL